MHTQIRLVICDLDGTLVDSRSDLVSSVNRMLGEIGVPALDVNLIASFIGRGMNNLVGQSLAAAGVNVDIREAADLFDRIYSRHLLDTTVLYPGVEETLAANADRTFVLVSNKPKRHTDTILRCLGIADRFDHAFGGDSFPELKPSPRPVIEVLRLTGCQPGHALLVGDSTHDMIAGKAAQVRTCAALYGFHARDRLVECRPDFFIESFRGLSAVL